MSEILEPETLEPEKLDLASLDIAAEKRAELLRLFPEARTEGGKIDFDRLRMALGETVDLGKERYGMNWPGKADCFKAIQRPSLGTLLPVREESVNFDETENLIIEGDNLEVLKLLQKSYQGKIKMIYIDPPYNTGNDFIYPDNYSESLQTYLEYTGQVDSEGRKFSNNTETDGRFHSKWLNMMYPRLYVARNLLSEDGSIFISINDVEGQNLRRLCDEIFGEENLVANMIWQKSKKGDAKLIAANHEYMLCYARNKPALIESGMWRRKKPGAEEVLHKYDSIRAVYVDNHAAISGAMKEWYASLSKKDIRKQHQHYRWSDERGLYFAADFAGPDDGRDSRPRYDIIHPITGLPCKKPSTGWRWDEKRTHTALEAKPPLIHFGPDETTIPCRKSYLKDISNEPIASVFYRDGRAGTIALEQILGAGLIEFPKDVATIADLVSVTTKPDSIILDFFAGSGTTGQAVVEVNRTQGTSRRFLLVQLPEKTDKPEYPTIAEITKERVRRVIQRHEKETEGKLELANRPKEGFRVLKLATSNFNVWSAETATTAPDALAQQLELHINHIRPGRGSEDLLCEILLKSGFPLTTPVETFGIERKQVFSVANGAMLICLDKQLTHEAIKAIAERKAERVVCLDEGFAGNDQLKTNAVLIMKSKGVTKFQTI